MTPDLPRAFAAGPNRARHRRLRRARARFAETLAGAGAIVLAARRTAPMQALRERRWAPGAVVAMDVTDVASVEAAMAEGGGGARAHRPRGINSGVAEPAASLDQSDVPNGACLRGQSRRSAPRLGRGGAPARALKRPAPSSMSPRSSACAVAPASPPMPPPKPR